MYVSKFDYWWNQDQTRVLNDQDGNIIICKESVIYIFYILLIHFSKCAKVVVIGCMIDGLWSRCFYEYLINRCRLALVLFPNSTAPQLVQRCFHSCIMQVIVLLYTTIQCICIFFFISRSLLYRVGRVDQHGHVNSEGSGSAHADHNVFYFEKSVHWNWRHILTHSDTGATQIFRMKLTDVVQWSYRNTQVIRDRTRTLLSFRRHHYNS